MPTNITDVSVFTDPIVAPAGADPRTAASVQTALQGLANRTRLLKDRMSGVPTRTVRMLLIAPALTSQTWLGPADTGASVGNPDFPIISNIVSGIGIFPLPVLPRDTVISRIQIRALPAAARAVVANRINFQLIRTDSEGDKEIIYGAGGTSNSDVVSDDGTAVAQNILMPPLGAVDHAIDEQRSYYLKIVAGTPTTGDAIYAVLLQIKDPTPRGNL